jgi:PAS domain S-box-containing protein
MAVLINKKLVSNDKDSADNSDLFRALYEASMDAIMTLEPPTWRFTAGNPATIKMFRVKDEKQFISLGPGDLSPEKQLDGQLSSAKAKKMIMEAMKNGNKTFEWTHKRYQGENFPAIVVLTKVEVNGKEFLQATVKDISELKKAEEILKERAAELEKMNKLMIGRELKMVELKEKIMMLEKKNNK